jgi:hypothetical protein
MPLLSFLSNKSLITGANSKIDKKTEQMIITQTKNSKELKDKISTGIKNSNDGNSFYDTGTNLIFESTLDLHASLHGTNYTITGDRISDNSWNINVSLSDTYDFELLKKEYADEFLLTVVNNGAYVYQKLGFLVPYKWDVSYSFVYEE